MPRVLMSFVVLVALAATACGDAGGASTTAESAATRAAATTAVATTATSAPSATPAATSTSSSSTTSTSTTTTTTRPPTTTSPGTVVALTISGGEVTGGGRVEVSLGEQVRLEVASDVADEVHVHGYDLFVDVAAGGQAVLEFVADIPGIFEVELEGTHVVLVELAIAP